MSKRDDDPTADMEVGMTTAERRRRRRRGGGLRVPSDNVPRRTSSPPVVAPVPEDPSLAMSIAYSFQPAESPTGAEREDGRVPRASSQSDLSADNAKVTDPQVPIPMAPDAMPTVIDPPATTGSEDFEMKTREMSAVDLEALGLTDPSEAGGNGPGLPGMKQAPELRFKKSPERPDTSSVEVDLAEDAGTALDTEDPDVEVSDDVEADDEPTAIAPEPKPDANAPRDRERLKTMALSEDDLEEVREASRANVHEAPTLVGGAPIVTSAPSSQPVPVPASESVSNRTQPLSALDIEVIKQEPPPAAPATSSMEPMSIPDIDIQELSERASETGDAGDEYEVDVEEASEDEDVKAAAAAQQAAAPRPEPPQAPPPPPVAAKSPPTPPPAAKKDKPSPPPKADTKPRGKPWFVDLFDEDYLRTLPFLTPQATQAEAEFVIDAMQLTPGAQVLDIGCGYGRHAMELAARGFHVVGLDLSTPLLVRGGEEAMRRGLQINFVRGDMRELDFDAQFDGAYCLFSTFGYFDDETNKKTIGNIARALKPGGKIALEILNRDYVIADLPTRVWWEGDGCVVLEEVELNYFSSRIQVNRSVVFDDGRQLEQEISVRAYSLHEVGKLMHAAGFRVLEVSGGYQTRGRFFGNQSRHIIVLAERKDTGV